MEETTSQRKIIVTFVAVALIAVIVVAAVAASPKKNGSSSAAATSPATSSDSSSSDSTTATAADTASNASFKDGSYTATGSYESPGGNEAITVHVTLQNGVITATSAESGAQDPEAEAYESMFINGYKSLVVGKQIASVNLSRVSGSSLTPQGFNEAISKIENQAKA